MSPIYFSGMEQGLAGAVAAMGAMGMWF